MCAFPGKIPARRALFPLISSAAVLVIVHPAPHGGSVFFPGKKKNKKKILWLCKFPERAAHATIARGAPGKVRWVAIQVGRSRRGKNLQDETKMRASNRSIAERK